MIFSLTNSSLPNLTYLPVDEFDIFIFSAYSNSVDLSSMPGEILFSMMSSLRMKKNILILDSTVSSDEKFPFNRGLRAHEGPGFIYLASHALSLLRPFSSSEIPDFQAFRAVLVQSKLLK